MTISEANAVNCLLDYLLRPRPSTTVGNRSQGDVLRAAQVLARSSNRALHAGWREQDITPRTRVRVPR